MESVDFVELKSLIKGLDDKMDYAYRENQQRIELLRTAITGQLDVMTANQRAHLDRTTNLENKVNSASSWFARTVGAFLIAGGMTAIWAVKSGVGK